MGCACSKGSSNSGSSPSSSRKSKKNKNPNNNNNNNNNNDLTNTDNNNKNDNINHNNNNNSNNNTLNVLQNQQHPKLESKNSFNNRQSIIQPNQKNKLDLIYSFNNLPLQTQYLLNSKCEYEDQSVDNDNDETDDQQQLKNKNENSALTPTSINSTTVLNNHKKHSIKTNREIQIYLSNSLINESISDLNDSIFNQLRQYFSQKTNNLDLNTIDFNSNNSQNNRSILNNKYFHRHLSKLILKDLLNNNGSSAYYSSSFSLFVVYFGDNFNFNNQDLLLPDKFELEDFKKLTHFSNLNLSLLQQYYKLNEKQKIYNLNLDYFKLNQSDLDNLDRLLISILDLLEKNEVDKHNLTSNLDQFKLKYFKTLQQEEIELIIKHADPSSIIWIHATRSSSSNDARYLYLLEKLQLKVLTHNYKRINSNEPINNKKLPTGSTSSSSSTSNSNNDQLTINDFLYNSIKTLIDSYLNEINKISNQTLAVKIDKSLSKELYKHYEIYKHYHQKSSSLLSSDPKICNQFESLINNYIKSKQSHHPLIIYENEDEYYHSEISYSELIAHWLHKHMNSTALSNQPTSIIYRFANQTIISSKLSTLLQNILHQLTYLLECHESFAFDSCQNLSQNILKLLKVYKFKNSINNSSSHHHDDSAEEIVIIIDRLDNLVHNTDDLNIVLDLIKDIYLCGEKDLLSSFKLIITYVNHQNTHLIKQLKNLFENSDKYIINTKLTTIDSSSKNSTPPADSLVNCFETIQNCQNSNIFDCILNLLNQSRYGLKESEIIDLIKIFNSKQNVNSSEIMIIWYGIKYLHKILGISDNLAIVNRIYDQNNQYLFKLNTYNKKFTLKLIKSNPQLNNQVFKYYSDLKSLSSISNLTERSFLEIPQYYLMINNMDHFRFIQQYLFNPKWLSQKSVSLGFNCLYLLHDFELCQSGSHNKELDSFLNNFYKNFYGYYQDPNQISISSSPNQINMPKLEAFSFYNDLIDHNLNDKKEYLNHVVFNIQQKAEQPDNKMLFFSQVKFMKRNIILTLSEFSNQINVFKINNNDSLELIRSIKLNKSPRDLKLFNNNRIVVLVDRNLHLFDLNKCIHLLDLNSTMNPNVPLFEIHDKSHVVLLARNRLSIILMKVPFEKLETKLESINESSSMDKTNNDIKINSEDMFLFKVGEDRYLNSLLVSRNGQVMVCGDEVQKPFPLLVWNLSQRKLIYDLRQAKHEFITAIQAISSSGRYVACACQEEGELKNCLIVYDLSTGQLFKKLKAKYNYVCVEISEESSVIISCLENSQIIIYDLNNGSKKFTINSNRYPINKIRILDTSFKFKNYFLTYDTSGQDWTIRLWDLSRGDILICSFTCPSRIISLDVNIEPFVNTFDNADHSITNLNGAVSILNNINLQICDNADVLVLAVSLYGFKSLLILKLSNGTCTKSDDTNDLLNDSDELINSNLIEREINL